MEANVQIAWQINFTVVAVVLGWVASAIIGVIFLMRQGIIIQATNDKIDDLRSEREAKGLELEKEDAKLSQQISANYAAFTMFKEKILEDYPSRQEMSDQRTEMLGFMKDFKRETLDAINNIGTRVDALHQAVKNNN